MKTFPLLAACLAALVLLPASADSFSQNTTSQHTRPLPNAIPHEEFPEGWQSYDQGLGQAKAQRKFVLIQFFKPGCVPCQKMGADVIAEPSLDDVIRQNFVLVRVNQASKRKQHHRGQLLSEKQLTAIHQVRQFPTLLFLGPDGKLIGRKLGYSSPQELHQLLNYLATGAYNKMAFDAFRAKQKRVNS